MMATNMTINIAKNYAKRVFSYLLLKLRKVVCKYSIGYYLHYDGYNYDY